jgi:hypothetical protein
MNNGTYKTYKPGSFSTFFLQTEQLHFTYAAKFAYQFHHACLSLPLYPYANNCRTAWRIFMEFYVESFTNIPHIPSFVKIGQQ